MLAAMTTWRACPNLDRDGQDEVDAWVQGANTSFAAGRKAPLKPDEQQAIAQACRRATNSVIAATERCHNGKPPLQD